MPRLFGQQLTPAELARRVGDLSQVLGVRLVEHLDGPERGVRVLEFRTGTLAFDLLVDRCLDLAGLACEGVPIGWHSPTGFRSPWLHEHGAEGGLGWLRSFSGMMNTCGLDHIMGPTEEGAEHYGYPYRKRIAHGLHGRIAYTPARLVGYGVRWEGERGVLWAEGEVRQAVMFGENLLLTRRVEAEVGGDAVEIRDRVTSLGFHPTPHALLYHVNFGWPVLDAGTRLVAPLRRTRHFVHDPSRTTIGPVEQAAPQRDFVEQVYEHELAREEDGTSFAALVNPGFPGGGLGVLVEYDARAMPAFYQWQNLQEGNYVVGLEPATLPAGSREDWKRRGELAWLGHGESRDYRLRVRALRGADAIAGTDERAASLLSTGG
jgi:hypothetical protein